MVIAAIFGHGVHDKTLLGTELGAMLRLLRADCLQFLFATSKGALPACVGSDTDGRVHLSLSQPEPLQPKTCEQ